MNQKLMMLFCITLVIFGCRSYNKPEREYFVRSCEFVCDYPFNDTNKWAIACRVWGLLKYHHPNVTAGKLDWDKVLLDGMDDIRFAAMPEMVNSELLKMLDAAGEYTYEKDDEFNDSLKMNVNLCWIDNSFLDDTLRNELKKIASLKVKSSSHYSIFFDSAQNIKTQNEKSYPDTYLSQYKYRLLTLFRYWNVIYYFFPHKYLTEQSWDKTLNEFIFPFIAAADKQALLVPILKLATFLDDGHVYTYGFENYRYYPQECSGIIEKIKDKTVVRITAGQLQRGDIVNRIGKRDVEHIRDSLAGLISASTRSNKEYRINGFIAEMLFLHETDVAVSRDGQEHELHVLPVTLQRERRSFARISNSIGYVDLLILKPEETDLMFQSFSDAKGIVFDLRKTGTYNYDVARCECYLSAQRSLRMFHALAAWDTEHPGAFFLIKDPGNGTPINMECPRFEGKVVYLIDEYVQSFLETQAWIARANFNATLIGRPTSGALGRTVRISLPGNVNVFFSGFGIFSLDGTALQRKGIIPDIEVYPTMESVMAGKDEILERAIEYLNNSQ